MSAASLVARIAVLSDLLDGTDIAELSWTDGTESFTLRREPDAAVAAAPTPSAPSLPIAGLVSAAYPGIVHFRHPMRDVPFVAVGQAVAAGDVMALLQVGPVLVPVVAVEPGTVLAFEAEEGALAGFGTPLLRLLLETAA